MQYKILIFFFLLTSSALVAQDFTTRKTASKKVVKLFEKAYEKGKQGDRTGALADYDKIVALDAKFIDGHIQRGYILYDLKQYESAVTAFQQVLSLSEDYRPSIFYNLGMTQWRMEAYEDAIDSFESYLATNPKNTKQIAISKRKIIVCSFAKNAIQYPVDFNPQLLPPTINTSESEYLPSLTADGELFFYTAVRGGQEDFYFSKKVDGQWTEGQPLVNINTNQNEGAQCISADGKLLVYTGCNRKGGKGSCDLYISEFKNGAWTPAQNMGSPINTSEWDTQPTLSSNGKQMIFSSKRKGGKGAADLWITYRNADGTWQTPQNLSPNINTAGDEESPFLHPDGQTLYFRSNGLPGMGGFDLYLSRKDENGEWGTPQNMGYPLNTPADEGTLVVSLDGQTGYFESNIVSIDDEYANDFNIYTFQMPEAAQPAPVTYVKAEVIHAVTKAPLIADIDFVDLAKNTTHLSSQTADDGTFLVCMPIGTSYALDVSKKGFLFHSENFELTENTGRNEPFILKIALQPIPQIVSATTQPIVLKNIFFETGSAALKESSMAELEKLKELLESNPDMRIQINGHTDNVGEDTTNQQLSENRAKSVYDYLVANGIFATRLTYKGFGESQPIDTNETETGKRNNRRTEFIVL